MNSNAELNNKKRKLMVKNIISIAKKKNKVKPLDEAFNDIPTSKEDHKGKLSYFN